MARIIRTIDLHQIVFDDDLASAFLGPKNNSLPYDFAPWKWDDRIWGSNNYENLDFAVSNLWDPATSNLDDSFFVSGVGSLPLDLEVIKLFNLRHNSQNTWSAKVRHGSFYINKWPRYLFATRGISCYVNPNDNTTDSITGHTYNIINLDNIPRESAFIDATMWHRDSNGKIVFLFKLNKVTEFTGTWTGGIQNSTLTNTGLVDWQYVDTSYKEFLVDYKFNPPKVVFNKDWTKLIGVIGPSHPDQIEMMEFLGVSDGTDYQVFYTKYFPIVDNAELVLYENDIYTTRTRMLPNSGKHYYGRRFGHKFQVGASGSGKYFFFDADRGEISFPQGASPAIGTKLYLSYRATVELQYEPNYSTNSLPEEKEINNNFTISLPNDVELNPSRTSVNRGFIYISEQDNQAATIELSVERKSLIASGLYGPIYLGIDYCLLVATVKNSFGTPVPGVEVSFFFPDYSGDDLGRLNGLFNNAIGLTNGDGEAWIIYTPPRDIEAIGAYINHPTSDPANSLFLPLKLRDATLDLNEIYTFSTLSGDPWLPYDASKEYRGGRKVIEYIWDAMAVHPTTGATGAYVPLVPNTYNSATGELQYSVSLPVDNTVFGSGLTRRCYWVTIDRDIDIQAKCYSSLYNKDIESNKIKLRISLPEYMKGKYIAAGLGTIPYGFRLKDNHLVAASGLSGATFISINPTVGPFPVYYPNSGSFVPTGEIANADPFHGTFGHKFDV